MGGLALQAGGAPMEMRDILAVFVSKAKVEAEEAQSARRRGGEDFEFWGLEGRTSGGDVVSHLRGGRHTGYAESA